MTHYSYTATAGQTTFSAVYTVGCVDVYLNGIKLDEADFTASSGTSIVLATPAALDDLVNIVGYETADAYSKAEVDAFLDSKQASLVSGTNIKTINGESLLGAGNLLITGGGGGSGGAGLRVETRTGVAQGAEIVIPYQASDPNHAVMVAVFRDETIHPGQGIPYMTSNTTPVGTASSSSNHYAVAAWYGFSSDVSSSTRYWAHGLYQNYPHWLSYDSPTPITANKLSIRSAHVDGYSWKLEGWSEATGTVLVTSGTNLLAQWYAEQYFTFPDCTFTRWTLTLTGGPDRYNNYGGYIKFNVYTDGDPYLKSTQMVHGTDYTLINRKGSELVLTKLTAGTHDLRVLILEGNGGG